MTNTTTTKETEKHGATPRNMEETNLHLSLRKRLSNAFLDLCYKVGRGPETVFDHFLEFVIFGFSLNHGPLTSWPYTKDETVHFFKMFREWVKAMHEILESYSEWFDFLGELYEYHVAGIRRKQGNGQFFTPFHIVDVMANVTQKESDKEEQIYDPCCGSGRTLLAAYVKNTNAILYGKDLDRTCCMMTVCNFIIHGCRGRVEWGNSLLPDDIKECWITNPHLRDLSTPLGLVPHCVLEKSPYKLDQYVMLPSLQQKQ